MFRNLNRCRSHRCAATTSSILAMPIPPTQPYFSRLWKAERLLPYDDSQKRAVHSGMGKLEEVGRTGHNRIWTLTFLVSSHQIGRGREPIFHSEIARDWRNPFFPAYHAREDTISGIYATPGRPDWCTRVLFRAWDELSASRLRVQWDKATCTPVDCLGSFAVSHNPPESFSGRQTTLCLHATYKRYEPCFISLQMSLSETARHVHRLHDRHKGKGWTYVSVIDADILARRPWKLLRAKDELAYYGIDRRGYGRDEWYEDEVLAIRCIPTEAVLCTIRFENTESLDRDTRIYFEAVLHAQLGGTFGVNAFVPQFWKA